MKRNYKHILWYGIAMAALLAIITYSLGISKSVDACHLYNQANRKILLADSLPQRINRLNRQDAFLSKKLGQSDTSIYVIKELILEYSSAYCKGKKIRIVDLPKAITEDFKELNIVVHTITFEGAYKELIKLLDQFENEYKVGKVASARIYKKRDRKSREQKLYMKLYIQNILNKTSAKSHQN